MLKWAENEKKKMFYKLRPTLNTDNCYSGNVWKLMENGYTTRNMLPCRPSIEMGFRQQGSCFRFNLTALHPVFIGYSECNKVNSVASLWNMASKPFRCIKLPWDSDSYHGTYNIIHWEWTLLQDCSAGFYMEKLFCDVLFTFPYFKTLLWSCLFLKDKKICFPEGKFLDLNKGRHRRRSIINYRCTHDPSQNYSLQ